MAAIAETRHQDVQPQPATRPMPAPAASVLETAETVHQIDQAHRAEADARAEARVTEALAGFPGHVHASVTDGIIRLFGACRDRQTAREIEAAVRRVARRDVIETAIHVLGPRCAD